MDMGRGEKMVRCMERGIWKQRKGSQEKIVYQKQRPCPLTGEWIKKLWYIYTMEYYSAIKRNASESFLMRWMNL